MLCGILVEDKHAKDISRAAKKLNAETITAEHINNSGNEKVQHLVTEGNEQERNQAARLEFVKGQSIINSTVRAKRFQRLPVEHWMEVNRHVITTAANEGDRIERAFRLNALETFKRALENETQVHTAILQRSQ